MTIESAVGTNQPPESLGNRIRQAVFWRSGSQILGQMIQWASTFLVIRILNPRDYGLIAMTQVIVVLLTMLNGDGLTSGLVQKSEITTRQIRQVFGMMLLLGVGLGTVQFAAAPLIAAYYRQPLVADLLRVQCLLYLITPFTAVPYALLARELDFRRQAVVNLIASIASAATALGGALAGFEVWALVFAPIVFFGMRALGMAIAARWLVWPSFDFRGSGDLARYGAVMALASFLWFVESQADIFIAGRHFSARELGIYSTALFLAQIFVAKFVPPLNEVAFSAYARLQGDDVAFAAAFQRAVRLIMVAAFPFYIGLAATARPLVLTALGEKWSETVPIVRLLAFAMPFMTLQVLFSPACQARGRPEIALRNSAFGAVVLAIGFLIGVRDGASGLAWGWIAAYPIFLAGTAWRSLPVIGLSWRALGAAIASPLLAALVMGGAVATLDIVLPAMPEPVRLVILVASGGLIYGAWLLVFAREAAIELYDLVRRRQLDLPAPPLIGAARHHRA